MNGIELLFIVFLVIIILVALGAAGYLAYLLLEKGKQLARYQNIIDLEAEESRLTNENKKLETKRMRLGQEEKETVASIAQLKIQLSSLEDEADIQSYGVYEPKYDFGSAVRYKAEIDSIRERQKQMVKEKTAVICDTDWQVQGSKTKGRKMINEQIRLMLRAFNGECDSLILKVKYNNINRIGDRIYSVYQAINKLGQSKLCQINQAYLELKIEELHLAHEYQEKRQAEAEEQRRIREQMREEQRAQRELEKAQLEAEKEEQQYQKALERAQKEIEQATGEKHDELQAEIERLNQALAEAHEKGERAKSRAEMTKSGYVYVVSNIGSFGKNIYKIGLTRRLEPLDRVKELGDASVPFQFDIHAMVFSQDAPALENQLHKAFDNRRVNRVNLRKEFFNVGLEDIKKVVHENHSEIEFTLAAEAEEYRKTQALIAREGSNLSPTSEPNIEVHQAVENEEAVYDQSQIGRKQFATALAIARDGQFREALRHLNTLEDILQDSDLSNRERAEVYVAKALCHNQLGDKQQRDKAWQTAYTFEPNYETLKEIAMQQGILHLQVAN
jgi:hypothetical protein